MKKLLLLLSLLSICSFHAFSQAKENENDLIKKTIGNLLESMHQGDTTALQDLFADKVLVLHVNSVSDTTSNVTTENSADYLKQVGAFRKEPWDMQIVRYDDMNVGNGIAVVWASYKFYIGKKFDHCGITVFQMIKRKNHWKFISVFYSIKTGNCPE